MKYFLLTIISLLIVGCSQSNSSINIDEELLRKHFSYEERLGLLSIVDFVNNMIMTTNPEENIEKAYHSYLDSMIDSQNRENYAPFDEEMKYSFLFSLDTNLFNKIWIIGTPRRIRNRDTSLFYPEGLLCLELQNEGPFIDLLKDLGKENEIYKEYHELIKQFGGLGPPIYFGFPRSNEEFFFNDTFDRLWASIFLLTIEESVDEKIERYLDNQNDRKRLKKLP